MTATLQIAFPSVLAGDFPEELPAAERAVARVLDAVASADLSSLAAHSPELAGQDWSIYLRCSIARMVHIAAALKRRRFSACRVLDYGSYFGNMSLMFAAGGHTVDAIDGYLQYGKAFEPVRQLLRDAGVTVLDFADAGRDLRNLPEAAYDVALCLGVIEHVPHTPRLLLESLNRVLKPGGCLVIDTPNHAYLYNRQRLAAGASVMPNIAAQFYANPPFEGHHREYTPQEIVWMLQQVGHDQISIELFNYSVYGLPVLTGQDLANYWAAALEPSARELILALSTKTGVAPARVDRAEVDWRSLVEEAEPSWVARVPPDVRHALQSSTAEALAARKLEEHYLEEIACRDREISAVHAQLGAVQRERDRQFAARVRRFWTRLRRLFGASGAA